MNAVVSSEGAEQLAGLDLCVCLTRSEMERRGRIYFIGLRHVWIPQAACFKMRSVVAALFYSYIRALKKVEVGGRESCQHASKKGMLRSLICLACSSDFFLH